MGINFVNIDEISILKNELLILEETQKALNDDELILKYDFNHIIHSIIFNPMQSSGHLSVYSKNTRLSSKITV